MSSFYKDLVNNNLYEKRASASQEDVKQKLAGYSDAQLEAIAQELDIFSKKAEETIEERETEKALIEESQSEKNLKTSTEEVQVIPSEDEVQTVNKSESDVVLPKKEDEEYALGEDAAVVETPVVDAPSTPAVEIPAEEPVVEEEKSAAEILEEMIKTASEDATAEEIIEKAAFARAEEILKTAGYDVADYIFSFIGDEKIAYEMADKVEKLATVCEEPILKVARDMVIAAYNVLEE